MQKHSDVFRAVGLPTVLVWCSGRASTQDSNSGLVEECMDRQRPQIVHKLTETYVALSLAEIATHLLIPDPDSTAAQAQTEQLIFDMVRWLSLSVSLMLKRAQIRRREIFAEVDRKGGEATVAFLSDPEPFNTVKTSNDIDFRIRMSEYMGQQAKQRSRNVGASKDFLQKVRPSFWSFGFVMEI